MAEMRDAALVRVKVRVKGVEVERRREGLRPKMGKLLLRIIAS